MERPARNRVTPMGEIEQFALRGAWTGNRGVLHRGHEIVRPFATRLWIVCALEFRGRWREQWLPNRYTFLFFHDEAVAFAAGHRPCAECRRASYNAYRDAWAFELGVSTPSATTMNDQLHRERLASGTRGRQLHDVRWADVPDGAFVLVDDAPHLVVEGGLVRWTHAGYAEGRRRPEGDRARVITPPSTLAVLRGGYQVQVDEGALRAL